ncbi:hypothetical protein BU15DRAFT_70310 [Melanogaster broomeanus]|nr:hypothetical protein BU15DRAFT_70310 [Melanogaster broomeanus]
MASRRNGSTLSFDTSILNAATSTHHNHRRSSSLIVNDTISAQRPKKRSRAAGSVHSNHEGPPLIPTNDLLTGSDATGGHRLGSSSVTVEGVIPTSIALGDHYWHALCMAGSVFRLDSHLWIMQDWDSQLEVLRAGLYVHIVRLPHDSNEHGVACNCSHWKASSTCIHQMTLQSYAASFQNMNLIAPSPLPPAGVMSPGSGSLSHSGGMDDGTVNHADFWTRANTGLMPFRLR